MKIKYENEMTVLNTVISNLESERELKIIEKQLMGISLTQSEKNRLSRDIRKKMDFIKEISKYEFDLNLKKGSEIDNIINETLEIIQNSPHISKIKRVLLFGSTADKTRIFRSDIDIAVDFENINESEAGKFRVYILGRANKIIDIQVYNVLPDKIKKEIDKNGKIIWKKE